MLALVGAGAGGLLAVTYVNAQQRQQTASWLQQVDAFIPTEIRKLERSSQFLSLLLQQVNGRFDDQDLSYYAPQLLEDLAPATALVLAPQGILEAIYPKPVSTRWQGVNLLAHSKYRQSSLRAVQQRQTVLQGPVPVLQGGVGLIVRTPVFIGPQQKFWGFASALGPWSSWLSRLESQALNHEPPMRFGLEIRDSQNTVYHSDDYHRIKANGTAGKTVTVPGGSVSLVAVPAGWTSSQKAVMFLSPLSGALIGAGVALMLLQQEYRRERAQLELELARIQAMERYQTLFEQSLDAVFVMDRERCVIEASPTVRGMYGMDDIAMFLSADPMSFAPDRQPDGRSSLDVAVEQINNAFETGGVEFEYWHQRPNTGELWLGQVSLRRIKLNDRPVLLGKLWKTPENALGQHPDPSGDGNEGAPRAGFPELP